MVAIWGADDLLTTRGSVGCAGCDPRVCGRATCLLAELGCWGAVGRRGQPEPLRQHRQGRLVSPSAMEIGGRGHARCDELVPGVLSPWRLRCSGEGCAWRSARVHLALDPEEGRAASHGPRGCEIAAL